MRIASVTGNYGAHEDMSFKHVDATVAFILSKHVGFLCAHIMGTTYIFIYIYIIYLCG